VPRSDPPRPERPTRHAQATTTAKRIDSARPEQHPDIDIFRVSDKQGIISDCTLVFQIADLNNIFSAIYEIRYGFQ